MGTKKLVKMGFGLTELGCTKRWVCVFVGEAKDHQADRGNAWKEEDGSQIDNIELEHGLAFSEALLLGSIVLGRLVGPGYA